MSGAKRLWRIIFAYVIFIYVTLPVMPLLSNFLKKKLNGAYSAIISLLVIFILLVILFKVKNYLKSARIIFWAIFLLLTSLSLIFLLDIPVERIHFLEYGLLGYLLVRVFSFYFSNWKRFVLAFVLGSLIGLLDEGFQGILQYQTVLPQLPRRYFEWRDVQQNAFGTLLGITFTRYVIIDGANLLSRGGMRLFGFEDKTKYNILFITIDSLRPDHMSLYGYSRNTSPNIDKIAEESFVFKNAFANSGWTSPSLVSLFSSLYPFTHGVEVRGFVLNPNIITPIEVLSRNGWKVYGEHYKGDTISNLGFESAATDIFSFLQKHKEETFFVWYHFRGPHLPYNPHPPYNTMFLQGEIDYSRLKNVMEKPYLFREDNSLSPSLLSAEDKEAIVSLYDGEVREQDEQIGKVVENLKELGLWEKTILVLTSDHGEEIFDHGYLGHASTTRDSSLYDEIIRVPLIIRIPNSKKVSIEEYIEHIDIMPTILDILGVKDEFHTDGQSILRKGKGKEKGGKIFASTSPCGWQCPEKDKNKRIYSIRTPDWKLIWYQHENRFELFDLKKDKKEQMDLSKKHHIVLRELSSILGEKILESKAKAYSIGQPLIYKE